MAYQIPNPNSTNQAPFTPTGNQPSIATGLNLPFNGPAVFVSNYTTTEAIKTDVINWFLTNKGERPLNPSFGGDLRSVLFEAITNENIKDIEVRIENDFATYFPMVTLQDVNVYGNEDYNQVKVEIKYYVVDWNLSETITLTF